MNKRLEVGEAQFSSRKDLAQLLQREAPLYAVLDAARDPAVLKLLRDSGEEMQSLYEGSRSESLAEVAPYLARVSAGSKLFEGLVGEGWGQSWGVFAVCDAPFAELRRHFRRFLVVQTEARQALHFRFYDPRVLRPFLEGATAAERHAFLGPVFAFLLEGRRENTAVRWERIGDAAPGTEAPWELFTIRDAQVEGFSQEIVALFVDRMAARFGKSLGRWSLALSDPREVIRIGIAQAAYYGFTTEREVERFLGLMVALGPSFDKRLSWPHAMLKRFDLAGHQRLSRLERYLYKRSARDSAGAM